MIRRKIFEKLKGHLQKKEISLIIGPRQAGKTTLMLLLKDHLKRVGERTLFLSFDFERDREFLSSQSSLLHKIHLEFGEKKGYVFIDEIQRKENAGLFLKGLYDMNLPYKFIVSGSGSLELKEKIQESLVGRKRIFELSTTSFEEFINFRTDYHYEGRLNEFFKVEKDRGQELLMEYLNFGGYPRVVLEHTLEEKKMIIDDIYRSVIEKDITYLLKIEKVDAFSSLIRILSSQIGKLVNYSELSSTLGISLKTLKNYLWYAEKTFIIQKITPYFKNVRKEITKSPIIYFYDLGLRNYILGQMGNLINPSDIGLVFQNLVLNILRDKVRFEGGSVHFWRTKDKAEVDFIIDYGRKIIPVETKFRELVKPEIGRSMKGFISKYQPEEAWIVNLGFEEKIRVKETEIKFIPYWRLII